MISDDELKNWFTYHPPTTGQQDVFIEIREAAYQFARTIVRNTPPSADQSAAIRHVRDAVMTANAAIVCGGQ